MTRENIIKAAENIDWMQVTLNKGNVCYHLYDDGFCCRAKFWPGHEHSHKFISFIDFLKEILPKERSSNISAPEYCCCPSPGCSVHSEHNYD